MSGRIKDLLFTSLKVLLTCRYIRKLNWLEERTDNYLGNKIISILKLSQNYCLQALVWFLDPFQNCDCKVLFTLSWQCCMKKGHKLFIVFNSLSGYNIWLSDWQNTSVQHWTWNLPNYPVLSGLQTFITLQTSIY